MYLLLVPSAHEALHSHSFMHMHPQNTLQQGRHEYPALSLCFHLAYVPANSIAELQARTACVVNVATTFDH